MAGIDARLSASLEAAAFLRRTQSGGGFGAVLRKGDPERGTLLVVVRSRGAYVGCLERALSADGLYGWTAVGPARDDPEEMVAQFLASRSRFDPDIWLIELDVPEPERFIAETTAAS